GGATCAGVLGTGHTGTLLCLNCFFNSSLCKPPCTQTCESLGYNCGTRIICGVKVDCGDCSFGYSCNVNGTCINRCTNSCSQLGLTECASSTYFRTCDNYDDDSCLEWGGLTSCGSGETCEGGECVEENTNPELPPPNPTGDIYYVSPSGSDTTGDGSINRPWFSLNKAWGYIGPGDIIYMRGGTYKYDKQTLSGKSGTSGNYINVWAYPYDSTKPKITKSSSYGSGTWPIGLIYIADGDYLYFKGLEISDFAQQNNGMWTCFWVFNSQNSIFENLDIHHCGNGATFENTDNCLILKSDFHHNLDPLTDYDVYGNADGLGIISENTDNTITIRGCRFWWNTDDGIDLWHGEGNVIIDNCWSWYNGFVPDTFQEAGNGNGFKLGDTVSNLPNSVLRTITNSLGVYNKNWGFLDNGARCNMKLYNNFAYQNCYRGYAEGWCGGYHFNLVSGIPYYAKNNIAYNNIDNEAVFDVLTNVNHNSWDTSSISISNSDFQSLDVNQLDDSRKSDGSLPDITFGHLVSGSDLINKGVNVGLSTDGYGNAIIGNPDLGAFEYSSSIPSCTSHASSACYSNTGDVYWYDSCGVREEIRYDCTSTQTCSNGQCVNSGTTNPPTNPTGDIYYVATPENGGSDTNGDGSINKPWATWQKGFNSISPGDILYIRGGVYSPNPTVLYSSYCGVAINSKKGTSDRKYMVYAYPGEKPILDGKNIVGTSYERIGVCLYYSAYWHLRGLEIRGVEQLSTGNNYGGVGMEVYGGNDILIENCTSHHNGGYGFGARVNANNVHFLNCDSYSNYDRYTDPPGEDADGFDVGYISDDAVIRLTGCRAWDNADDGFDMYQGSGYSGVYYLKNCWAWHNGYIPGTETTAGNGCGFKYGDDYQSYDGVTRRFSYNCIAYDNRERGFSQESANVKKEFYNCISYNNGAWGWSFYGLDIPDILHNNIAFGDGIEQLGSRRNSDYNSWDVGVSVTSADFLSVDGSQLDNPRKIDGSLPDITFLHLASGSDLINKGTPVSGINYAGSAPDLGPFERE
ncbi:MAG: right-handed parallel beta-helix repeat-containing protein, partial [Nanobdellota archaeon]